MDHRNIRRHWWNRRLTYQEYLRSDYWRKFRSKYLLAHPHCCKCHHTSSQVHHKRYTRLTILGKRPIFYHEKFWQVAPICADCHKKLHGLDV